MRKAVIIIIQILIVIVFLQSSFAQHFFGDVANALKSWYTSIVEMPERSKINSLRDAFMINNMSLQTHQVDYVLEVTESVDKIEGFHRLYCVKKDKNPYIYGANLAKFCADIGSSGILNK